MRQWREYPFGLWGILAFVTFSLYILFESRSCDHLADTKKSQHTDGTENMITKRTPQNDLTKQTKHAINIRSESSTQKLVLMKSRNSISRQLNDEIRNMGKLECQVINSPGYTKSKDGNGITSRGGYCKWPKFRCDKTMCYTLSDLLKGKSVASFGDGPGAYKKQITELGKIKLYDAYDGSPFIEEHSKGTVSFLDLAIPQFGLPLYDWVVSLEVAEHIPQDYEHIYVENLARHAIEGIVNSWAIPDQPGFYHVNGKTVEEVVELFRLYGFEHDVDASLNFRKKQSNKYYKRNCNVFKRVDGQSIQNLTFNA